MSGYYEKHMAVEFYKGEWILRARSDDDLPLESSAEAMEAMDMWKRLNAERYERAGN